MQPEELFNYYTQMGDNRVLVSFKGPVSRDILMELGGCIRRQLVSRQAVKRVFGIFVELMQNVLRHSAERDASDTGIGVLSLVERNGFYVLSSGNRVSKEAAQQLVSRCGEINAMSEEELNAAYRAQRKSGIREENSGAGLGLYEMGRKSDEPLVCKTIPMDEAGDFFILTAQVRRGEREETA